MLQRWNQHVYQAGIMASKRSRFCNASKVVCKRGHEFTEENTYTDRLGSRNCRACRRHLYASREKTP